MKTYKQKKEEVRQQAIEWQNNAAAGVLHWTSVFWGTLYFEQKGRRYGLLTEFKENGII